MTQPPGGVVGPVGGPPAGSPPASAEAQVTLEQSWKLYRDRIATKNPQMLQELGHALDAVNNLMRTH